MTNPLLHFKSFGEKNHSASIVLLHGMLGSMDNWRSQAKQLSAHFHVITPDLRNHGRSPHISGMRYQDMANDVLALTNHLGIEKFDLLGHSMGGKIAMEMALTSAEKIERLVVVDIVPKPYQLWHLVTFKALLGLPVADFTSRAQADTSLAEHIEDPFERAFLLKNLKSLKSGGYEWRCNLQEITRAYLNIANFTQKPDAHFDHETLFIKGGKSPYLNLDTDPEVIKQFFPKAVIETIKGAGHTPHVEKTEAFNSILSKFLALPDAT